MIFIVCIPDHNRYWGRGHFETLIESGMHLITSSHGRKGPFIFYEVGRAGGIWGGHPKKNGLKGGGI